MKNPKDAQQALRFARTQEKADALLLDPKYAFVPFVTSDRMFYVVKDGVSAYVVDNILGSCTCPDFKRYGDVCKHTMAADTIVVEREMWNVICDEEDARFAEML